jgi:hypothetical protein
MALPGPDQVLVRPGQDLNGARELGVAGDRAMVVSVGADQIGEQLGVAGVRLGPRGGVAVAVAADRQRVHCIDPVPGRKQRPDQQPAVGLDPDHHLLELLGVLADQFVQPAHALQPVWNAALAQHLAQLVEQADVMVGLSPINPNEDQSASPSRQVCRPSRRRSATR